MKRLFKPLTTFAFIFALLLGCANAAELVTPKFIASDQVTGARLPGSQLYTLSPGTSWPSGAKTAYTDKALTQAASNPVTMDGNGEALIYLSGSYKLILTSSDGTTQQLGSKTYYTVDNWEGIGVASQIISVSNYTNFNAAVTSIGSTKAELWVDSPQTLTGSLTVSSTLTVRITSAASIALAGYTLVFSGPLENYGAITGSGSVSVTGSYAGWGTVPGGTTANFLTNTSLVQSWNLSGAFGPPAANLFIGRTGNATLSLYVDSVTLSAPMTYQYETQPIFPVPITVSVNLSINAAVNGINGLDTGSLAASKWYWIYVIYNPATKTVKGLASLIPVALNNGPVLPSGYTLYRVVGVARTDGSGNFVPFTQQGLLWLYDEDQQVSTGTTAQTWVATDCSPYIPETYPYGPSMQQHGLFAISMTSSGTASTGRLKVDGSASSNGHRVVDVGGTSGDVSTGRSWVDVDQYSSVKINVSQAVTGWTLFVSGFQLNQQGF